MPGIDDAQAPLRQFTPTRDFFIGIDSDGCAFDTMEVKHKECFIPHIVETYLLAAVSKYVREVAEFINLYSRWRGINRFPGLLLTFDMLAERPEVVERGFKPFRQSGLRDWVAREIRLANPALKAEADATGDADLIQAYEWSVAVNAAIARVVKHVLPFPFVRDSLESVAGKADVMVVSATPGEALIREWEEHDLARHVALIAGQEMGQKAEHLRIATGGRYDPHKVLMVGDAPADYKAAQANGALFYPINPGGEIESWRRFHDEALPHFFAGTYAGDYMNARIAEFEALLPTTPPWRRAPA